MPRKPTPDIMTDILAGQPAGALAPGSMTGAVHDIDLDLIDDNPWQPRQTYEPVALEELAGSIERNGLHNKTPSLTRRAFCILCEFSKLVAKPIDIIYRLCYTVYIVK